MLQGCIQFGARKGHSAIELIFLLRIILEKAMDWRLGLIIVSLDLIKAFGSLSLSAVFYFVDSLSSPLPIRLRYAFLKELMSERKVDYSFEGITTDYVFMQKGN